MNDEIDCSQYCRVEGRECDLLWIGRSGQRERVKEERSRGNRFEVEELASS